MDGENGAVIGGGTGCETSGSYIVSTGCEIWLSSRITSKAMMAGFVSSRDAFSSDCSLGDVLWHQKHTWRPYPARRKRLC